MIRMTGLKACDTCSKARKWLDANGIEYFYVDVKADGVPKIDLERYISVLGWEKVLNKSSTTWRSLDEVSKTDITDAKAVLLLLNNPSLMKRPLFEIKNQFVLGFKEDQKEIILNLV